MWDRDRVRSAVAAALLQGLLAYGLIVGLAGGPIQNRMREQLIVFGVLPPPPPPPEVRPPPRRIVPPPRPAEREKAKPTPTAAASPRVQTKLTYKDQRDYDLLPARIEEIEAAIARDEQALADPDLYARDPGRFASLTATIDKARTEKDAAELRWLELAEKVEALG